MNVSIRDILTEAASCRSNDNWLLTPENKKCYSWNNTLQQAESIACHLKGAGLSEGSSVAIAAQNSAAACFTFLGAVYGGFRATPLNLVAGSKNLAFVLIHSKTKIILCTDDCLSVVNEALDILITSTLI